MPQKRTQTTKARPIRGKEQSFTARITPETREALRQTAEASGHSMSSEMELLLRSALKARDAAENQINPIFERGWEIARAIIETAGHGPRDSVHVYHALQDVLDVMSRVLPMPSDDPSLAALKSLDEQIQAATKARRGRRVLQIDDAPDELAVLKLRREAEFTSILDRCKEEDRRFRVELDQLRTLVLDGR